jgi:hypothetical protein
MKTNTLPIIAFLAAIAAVALVPVSATTACVAFTVTGLLSTLVADYGRSPRAISASAPVVPFEIVAQAEAEQAA